MGFGSRVDRAWQLEGDATDGMYQLDFSLAYAVYQLYAPPRLGPGARYEMPGYNCYKAVDAENYP